MSTNAFLPLHSDEVVALVCKCSGALDSTCSGKFKLKFLGHVLSEWFYPENTVTASYATGATTIVVTSVLSGSLAVGQTIAGTGIPEGTKLAAQLTITGMKVAAVVTASVDTTTNLVVTSIRTGSIYVGQVVSGQGIATGTTVAAIPLGSFWFWAILLSFRLLILILTCTNH